ncbi:GDP-mannose 4,6-dehydratase [bacterium]|nr:GDP-mannose 4,6-dehydratase [bacterium]
MDEAKQFFMKFLILGCGSFAGQSVFEHLLSKGEVVYGINRSKPKSAAMWPWIAKENVNDIWFTQNIVDDLDQIINLVDTLKPNIIIDFMGQGMVAQSWADPGLWFHTNITQKSILIKHLSHCDFIEQYIRASTPEVYGSSLNPQTPLSSFNPTTPYAVSHASIDNYIRCLGNSYGFPYKIGRFANFYGVGQQLYRVIPRLILSCLTNTKFTLDGGGTSLRSFINTEDICTAFDLLIQKASLSSEYNFSGCEEVSISDLVDKICNLCNVPRTSIVETGPERAGKDMCYRLNCTQSQIDLGWTPEVSLNKGVSSMISWIEDNLPTLSELNWNYVHRR